MFRLRNRKHFSVCIELWKRQGKFESNKKLRGNHSSVVGTQVRSASVSTQFRFSITR